jgi:hypothetical protein
MDSLEKIRNSEIARQPTLEALIDQAKALEARFGKLAADYPKSNVVCRPTDLSWRPLAGQKIPDVQPDMLLGVRFHEDIRLHCCQLHVLFVDWLDKPHVYRRFPLCALVYSSTTSHSQGAFEQILRGQVRLLQIELAKSSRLTGRDVEGPQTNDIQSHSQNIERKSSIRGTRITEEIAGRSMRPVGHEAIRGNESLNPQSLTPRPSERRQAW